LVTLCAFVPLWFALSAFPPQCPPSTQNSGNELKELLKTKPVTLHHARKRTQNEPDIALQLCASMKPRFSKVPRYDGVFHHQVPGQNGALGGSTLVCESSPSEKTPSFVFIDIPGSFVDFWWASRGPQQRRSALPPPAQETGRGVGYTGERNFWLAASVMMIKARKECKLI